MPPEEAVERVRAYLDARIAGLQPIEYPVSTERASDAASALGVELGQIAKSILFRCGDTFGLFILPGDRRADHKKIRALLGGGKVRIADSEAVYRVTGFHVGGVCPYALKTDLPIYLDRSLERFERIYTAAGSARAVLPITLHELRSITGGSDVDIT